MAVQLPEHYKETSVSNPNAIGDGITNASQTATKYITTIDSNNGIQVHAESIASTDYAQLDATGLDVVKASESVAKFGTSARIGKTSDAHMIQSSTETVYYEPNGVDKAMSIGLDPRTNDVRISIGNENVDVSDRISIHTVTSEQDGVVTYDEGLIFASYRGAQNHFGQIELEAYGEDTVSVRISSRETSGADVDITPEGILTTGVLSASNRKASLKGDNSFIYLNAEDGACIRINKSNGAVQFYNASTSTWVVIGYPTISSNFTLQNATASAHSCRRNGWMSTINARGLQVSSSLASGAHVTIGTVPSGYRPAEYVYATVNTTTVANSLGLFVAISSAGVITLYNTASVALPTSAALYFTATYVM